MVSLTAEKRNKEESNNALREQGELPAVVYGPEREDTAIKVKTREFRKAYHQAGPSSLIDLDLEGEPGKVLIYDLQKHPVSGDPLHVDFYAPPLEEEVRVEVPLEFTGQSNAVDTLNGTLIRDITRVNVKTLPEEIPDEIEVDISALEEFSDDIQIKDLETSSKVEVMEDPEKIVAYVAPPKDVEQELEQPIEEEIEEIETVEEAEETEEIEEAEQEELEEEEEELEEEPEQEQPPQQ